jgi:hypothetical protein
MLPMSGLTKVVSPRLAGALAAALLSIGGLLATTAAPSAAVSGGTCPVAYDQSIFVSIPLPAHSNGVIQGQIGVDCSGYTQMQVSAPPKGKITWSGALNEDYAYSPKPGYFGGDSVSYCQVLISNPSSGCQSPVATLSFFMGHANNDAYATPEGTPLFVGCTGCPGDPLTNDQPSWYALAKVNSLPKHGTLTWEMGSWSPASFGYQPKPGFVGTDSFSYCMSFHTGNGCPPTYSGNSNGVTGIVDSASSNIATVTITVLPKEPLVRLILPPVPFLLFPKATLLWSGEDYSGGPGLSYYQVRTERARWNAGFGPWAMGPHLSPTTVFTQPALATGYDSCFEVRAVDKGGKSSPWTAPYCVARPLDDASLAASGGWTRKKNGLYYQGTFTVTTQHLAKLTLTGAKADRLAVVATRCAGCGQIGVYEGTKLIAAIDLSGTGAARQTLFFLPAFPLSSAKISIVVLSTGKTVEIDGLGVSRT